MKLRKTLTSTFSIWSAGTLLLVALLSSFATDLSYRASHNKALNELANQQAAALTKDNEIFGTSIRSTISSLELLLARSDDLGSLPSEAIRSALFANPSTFQARWLSLNGKELIRFDKNFAGIERVPDSQLQDKSDRNYFKAMQQLAVGQIYMSRFDLNVEHGQIEVPFRPTVRIGLRLDSGYVLANLDLTQLLARINSNYIPLYDTWLVSTNGDWLIAPEESLEWGFMFGEPKRIQDTLEYQGLEQLLGGRAATVIDYESSNLLISQPLNLGSGDLARSVLAEDQPIIVRHLPPGLVEGFVKERQPLPQWLAQMLIALISIAIFFGLQVFRERILLRTARTLQEAEIGRLTGIANLMPQLTWTTNEEGVCDFVNSRWESYTGQAADKLIGSGWFEFVHPEDRDSLQDRWHYSVISGEDFAINFRIRNKLGEYRMFDTRAHALTDSSGNVIKWFGSNTDIQAAIDLRHQLERENVNLNEQLAASLEEKQTLLNRFEFAADSAQLGIWEYSPRSQQMVWDSRMYAIYGSRASLTERAWRIWRDSIHPDDLSDVDAQLQRSIDTGASLHVEYRIRLIDGTTRWVRDDASFESPGAEDRGLLIGCTQDITVTKSATLSLQEALAHLEQARRVGGIGLFRITLATNESEWSNEVYTLLRRSKRQRLTLDQLFKSVDQDTAEQARTAFDVAVREQETFDRVIRVKVNANEWRFIRLIAEGVNDATGNDLIIYGAMFDVTEQKRSQEALEQAKALAESANAAKSAFLANISHEIRTPMNGVLGLLSILKNRIADSENRSYANKAHQAAERLMGILNDVLDISRIDSGKLNAHLEEVEIETLVQEAVDLFSVNADEKSIDLQVEVAPSVPDRIVTDGLRVGQIISNLVGNAIKFTKQNGRVQVHFSVKFVEQRHQLCIRVQDNGIGMSPEQLDTVFEAFAQAENSTTKRFGGTGLGLSICRRLVTLLKGNIEIDSKEGVGTSVDVRIPVEYVKASSVKTLNFSLCLVDILTLDPHLEAHLRPQLAHLGMKLQFHSSLSELERTIRHRAPGPAYLIVDSGLLEGPAGEAFIDELVSHQNLISQFEQCVVHLPARTSTSLRNRLNTLKINLVYGRIGRLQLEKLLASTSDSANLAPANGENPKELQNLKIVSVDDVALNNEVIQGLMQQDGLTIETLSSGADAVERARRGDVDLFLMDVHMPELDGLETTKRIRSLELKHKPLIFGLSASVLPEDREQGLDAGMDDYLNKPFEKEALFQALIKHLDVEPLKISEPTSTAGQPSRIQWPSYMDLEYALKQTSGSEEALINLARAFVNGFKDQAAEYRKALASDDLKQAQMLMHRLKGASAYIGDLEINAQAAALETMLKQSERPQDSAIADLLEAHIKQLSDAIGTDDVEDISSTPQDQLPSLTNELIGAYSDNCFVPPSEWKPYIKGLQVFGLTQAASELSALIEEHEFPSAASKLIEIRSEIEHRGGPETLNRGS